MKKTFSILLIVLLASHIYAQKTSTATTPVKTVNLQKIVVPPYLTVANNSVKFTDSDGNNIINASEKCDISFTIQNTGKGDAIGCVAKITGEGTTGGLTFNDLHLPIIKSGENYRVTIPIQASRETQTGLAKFILQVDEPNGFGIEPIQLEVNTHRFNSPLVEIVSYKIVSIGDQQLRKKRPFKLQVLLQNTDQGVAKDVQCSFTLPENMFLLDGSLKQEFATLAPNEQKILEFELQSNTKVADDVNIEFKLSESYGKYAKNATVPLHFGQAISSGMTSIQVAGIAAATVEISKGSLVSDVDENIPKSDKKNNNTFAVIIANEYYQQVAAVPFAMNDGKIFKQYCEETLGIPAKNINYKANATGGQIQAMLDWISMRAEVLENPNIILYYAGHGIPDEASKTAYLVPVDATISNLNTCVKLDDLYATLGKLPLGHISVFMDACFSGSKREQGMLASARGIALKARPGQPQGNMVVFSAAQGDETAYPYATKQHGLFTYYLLKKLQETKGNVTLQDLSSYITTEVKKQSVLENNKLQTPCVTPATTVADSWKTWKLK